MAATAWAALAGPGTAPWSVLQLVQSTIIALSKGLGLS